MSTKPRTAGEYFRDSIMKELEDKAADLARVAAVIADQLDTSSKITISTGKRFHPHPSKFDFRIDRIQPAPREGQKPRLDRENEIFVVLRQEAGLDQNIEYVGKDIEEAHTHIINSGRYVQFYIQTWNNGELILEEPVQPK